jgi:hypothetical protein
MKPPGQMTKDEMYEEATRERPVACYGVVRGWDWQQEHYETASRDAGRRARGLRRLGFRVSVAPLGPQVTRAGVVRMSMLTVYHLNGSDVPAPDSVVQL